MITEWSLSETGQISCVTMDNTLVYSEAYATGQELCTSILRHNAMPVS